MPLSIGKFNLSEFLASASEVLQSEEDKNLFRRFIANCDDEILGELKSLSEKDKGVILKLVGIIQSKKEYLSKGKESQLIEILQRESSFVDNF